MNPTRSTSQVSLCRKCGKTPGSPAEFYYGIYAGARGAIVAFTGRREVTEYKNIRQFSVPLCFECFKAAYTARQLRKEFQSNCIWLATWIVLLSICTFVILYNAQHPELTHQQYNQGPVYSVVFSYLVGFIALVGCIWIMPKVLFYLTPAGRERLYRRAFRNEDTRSHMASRLYAEDLRKRGGYRSLTIFTPSEYRRLKKPAEERK